jgi:hypothetical protein
MVKIECPCCHEILYSEIGVRVTDKRTGPQLTSLKIIETCTHDELIGTISKFIEANGRETIEKYNVETVFTNCLGISPTDVPELAKIFLATE